MNYKIVFLFFFTIVLNQITFGQIINEEKEAIKAIHFLNRVRQNPAKYSDSCKVDLSKVKALPPLKIDKILMKVAAEKATDLAQNNYFAHVNKKGEGINVLMNRAGYTLEISMLGNLSNNYFESISAGLPGGIENIINLIEDEGVNPPGHRIHLLGMDEFYAKCTDIGIGFVSSDKTDYTYYMVVIIAKHDL